MGSVVDTEGSCYCDHSRPPFSRPINLGKCGGGNVVLNLSVVFANKRAFVNWQTPIGGAPVSYLVQCTGQPDQTITPTANSWERAAFGGLTIGNNYTVSVTPLGGSLLSKAGTVTRQDPETLTAAGDFIAGPVPWGRTLTPYGGPGSGLITVPAGTYNDVLFTATSDIQSGGGDVILNRCIVRGGVVNATGARIYAYDTKVTGETGNQTGVDDYGNTVQFEASQGFNDSHIFAEACEIRRFADGIQSHGDVNMAFNLIHELVATVDSHNDGFQIFSGTGFVLDGNGVRNGFTQSGLFTLTGDTFDIHDNWVGGFGVVLDGTPAGAVTNGQVHNNVVKRSHVLHVATTLSGTPGYSLELDRPAVADMPASGTVRIGGDNDTWPTVTYGDFTPQNGNGRAVLNNCTTVSGVGVTCTPGGAFRAAVRVMGSRLCGMWPSGAYQGLLLGSWAGTGNSATNNTYEDGSPANLGP